MKIERDLNQTAKDLGAIVADLNLYYQRGKPVFHDHMGKLRVMTGIIFRTWINHQGVITFLNLDAAGVPIPCSLSIADAAAILESVSFLMCVKPLGDSNDEGGGL